MFCSPQLSFVVLGSFLYREEEQSRGGKVGAKHGERRSWERTAIGGKKKKKTLSKDFGHSRSLPPFSIHSPRKRFLQVFS